MNMEHIDFSLARNQSLERNLEGYEVFYDCTLSNSPRTEIVSTALAVAVALGLFYCVLVRMGTDIRPDFGILILWFLGSFMWNLRKPAAMAAILADEGMLRLTWGTSYYVNPILEGRGRDKVLKELSTGLLAFLAIALAATVISTVDSYLPTVFTRRAAYTGGG